MSLARAQLVTVTCSLCFDVNFAMRWRRNRPSAGSFWTAGSQPGARCNPSPVRPFMTAPAEPPARASGILAAPGPTRRRPAPTCFAPRCQQRCPRHRSLQARRIPARSCSGSRSVGTAACMQSPRHFRLSLRDRRTVALVSGLHGSVDDRQGVLPRYSVIKTPHTSRLYKPAHGANGLSAPPVLIFRAGPMHLPSRLAPPALFWASPAVEEKRGTGDGEGRGGESEERTHEWSGRGKCSRAISPPPAPLPTTTRMHLAGSL